MKLFNANAIEKIRRTVRRVLQSPYAHAPEAGPQQRNDLCQTVQAYDSEADPGDALAPNDDGFIPGRLVRWNGVDNWAEVSDVWLLALPDGAGLTNEGYYATARRIGIVESDESKRPGFVVQTPSIICFTAGIDSVQAGSGDIQWVERTSTGAAIGTLSSGVLTFTLPGVYLVTVSIAFTVGAFAHDGTGRTNTLYVYGKKNGSSITESLMTHQFSMNALNDLYYAQPSGGQMSCTFPLEVAVDDTFAVYVNDTGAVASQIEAGGSGGSPDWATCLAIRYLAPEAL